MLFPSRTNTVEKQSSPAKPSLLGRLGNALKNKMQQAVEVAKPKFSAMVSQTKEYFENKIMEVTNVTGTKAEREDAPYTLTPTPAALQETYAALEAQDEPATQVEEAEMPDNIVDFTKKLEQKARKNIFTSPTLVKKVGETRKKPGERVFKVEGEGSFEEDIYQQFAQFAMAYDTPYEAAEILVPFFNTTKESRSQQLEDDNQLPLKVFKAIVTLMNFRSPILDLETRKLIGSIGANLEVDQDDGETLFVRLQSTMKEYPVFRNSKGELTAYSQQVLRHGVVKPNLQVLRDNRQANNGPSSVA